MAQLALAAAGAWAGSALAAGGAIGISAGLASSIGWTLGSMLGSALFAKDETRTQPMLNDLRVMGTEYGQPIPWVRGHPRIAGQIWWASQKRPIPHYTESGGKGGPTLTTITYSYEVDLLVGLTSNIIAGVSRGWSNGKLTLCNISPEYAASLANESPTDPAWIAHVNASAAASAATDAWARLTVYTGDITQMPDPTYEAAVGAANAPAYRNHGSLFVQSLNLGGSGQIPNLSWEVYTSGTFTPAEWNLETVDPDYWTWTANEFLNGEFIAAHTSDVGLPQKMVVSHSDDGVEWVDDAETTISVDPNGDPFKIACNGDVYVMIFYATGGATNTYMKSEDGGHTWTQKTFPYFGTWSDLKFINGEFVALCAEAYPAAAGFVLTSTDAESWNKDSTLDYVQFWQSLTYGNGVYVASPQYGDYVLVSPDLAAWVPHALPSAEYLGFPDFGKGLFVLPVGGDHGGSINYVFTSIDGEAWEQVALPISGSWLQVKIGTNLFVMVQYRFRPATGETVISTDGEAWTELDVPAEAYDYYTWLAMGNGRFVGVSSGYGAFYWLSDTGGLVTPQAETLQGTVRLLCLRAGQDESQFNVAPLAAITKAVHAMAVSEIVSTRAVLEKLAAAYFFGFTVSDVVTFVPRGGSAVVTIPYEHLGAIVGSSDSKNDPFELLRLSDIEIPAQIAITAPDIINDYAPNTQWSDRFESAVASSVLQVSIGIGFTPTEIKGICEVVLGDMIASILSATISVLCDYAYLEPTDVINVVGPDGTIYRMRVIKLTDDFPRFELDIVLDDESILSSQGITNTNYTGSTTVNMPSETVLELMDIPMLRDADDDPGVYGAEKGSPNPWPGGSILRSADDLEFTIVETVTESAVIGVCTTILGNWTGPVVFDEVNSVTVNLGDGVVSSVARAAILADPLLSLWLIGGELVQARDAVLIAPSTFTLSGLLRGLRDTEAAMVGHVAGEHCVLMRTTGGVRRLPMQSYQIGIDYYWRGVTMNRKFSTATSQLLASTAVSLMPFSPTHLTALRDPATGDIAFTVLRRSRRSTLGISSIGQSIPLGEEIEAYEMDIYADGTYTTVKRMLPSTNGTFAYTAAQQATDFGGLQALVCTKTYQLSAIIGRGKPLTGAA